MKSVALAAFFVLISSFMASAATKPDFAFPKKVSATALRSFERALDTGDAPASVRALIDYGLAQGAVDNDSLSRVFTLLDRGRRAMTDPTARAVYDLLEADIYTAIYNANRYTYDARKMPLSPLPPDYNLWSGAQFRKVISDLVVRAMGHGAGERLTTWRGCISGIDRAMEPYYPFVSDFIYSKGIDLLGDVLRVGNILPVKMISASQPGIPANDDAATILEAYRGWLSESGIAVPTAINASLRRLDFIVNHVADRRGDEIGVARDKALRDLLGRYGDSEYSGQIIAALADIYVDNPEIRFRRMTAVAADAEELLRRFPNAPQAGCLKNIIVESRRPQMSLTSPTMFAPGEPVEIAVTATNVVEGRIDIYRVASASSGWVTLGPSATKIGTLSVSSGPDVPARADLRLSYTFPSEGSYILVPVLTVDGYPDRETSYEVVTATRLALAVTKFTQPAFWVVDPESGEPVEGATVKMGRSRQRTTLKTIGTTDANGTFAFDPKSIDGGGYVVASKGSDNSVAVSFWNSSVQKPGSRLIVKGFTALPLYRPGDEVLWSAIAYETGENGNSLAADRRIKVTMRDANYQVVDTLSAVTDSMGRIEGSFAIPQGGLSGNFTIIFDDGAGQADFTVSDYKLPTFAIDFDRPRPNASGDYTISGTVKSYSGFPQADAAVALVLSSGQRWRWWGGGLPVEFASLATTTDADGCFSVTIGSSGLALAPYPDGIFTVRADVTAANGESHTASTSFSIGKALSLMGSLPAAIDASVPTAVDIRLVDVDNKPVGVPVSYTIARGDSVVARGTLPADRRLDLASVPSGRVDITFSAADADSLALSTVIYRPTDKTSPVEAVLWTPAVKLALPSSRRGRLLVGAAWPTYAQLTIATQKRIVEQRWVKLDAGLREIDITLPDEVDDATLTLAASARYRVGELSVALSVDGTSKAISLSVESFRDKTRPGDNETWRFSVSDAQGRGRQAALLLDMYNNAIAALEAPSFGFRPYSFGGYSFTRSIYDPSSKMHAGVSKRINGSDCFIPGSPDFNTWSRAWLTFRGYIRGTMLMKSSATFNSAMTADEAAVEEVADLGAAAPRTAGGNYAAGEDEAKDGQTAPGNSDCRPAEMPLALWRPVLTTDADGRLTFTFTVPNANTTWTLAALAVTPDVMTDLRELEMTVSKPVMVQPNPPRFMRAGDKAVVATSVMNNSESPAVIDVTVEAYNPADGRIVASLTRSVSVGAMQAAVVDMPVVAEPDLTMIGLRVRGRSGSFADGEQTIIPVLPSATSVIESTPFYIAPGDGAFTLDIPAGRGSDNKLVLDFTENPAWAVVTALPGLLDGDISTSPEAAASIFSAAVARGLIRDNKAIARALEEWTRSDRSDSTLVSMLERNNDLKMLMLRATPWMADAAADTERMTRLALLFDRATTDRAIANGIDVLARLVREKGWSWTAGGQELSPWATTSVLFILGRLNSLGYMPADKRLARMIENAVEWFDADAAREYRRYPQGNYTFYTFVRDLYPDIAQSTAASAVSSATVQQLLGRWRDLPVVNKAVAALILEHHSYHSSAMTILESLREYANVSPTRGMWWPSAEQASFSIGAGNLSQTVMLQAFAAVDPSAKKDIEAIRQWLILQKEVQNWGASPATTDIVATFLQTSGRWMTPARGVDIAVDGNDVELPQTDRLMGHFRVALPADASTLSIGRQADAPSWGAVIRRYTAQIDEIPAASQEDLSITKRYLVVDNTDVSSTEPIAVGRRVRVELTVKAKRALQYVTIVDDRPACFEPVEQLPGYLWSEGLGFYRENASTATRLFVDAMPAGTYVLTYDMWVNNAGEFLSGVATAQSQYAPAITAHSAGSALTVR